MLLAHIIVNCNGDFVIIKNNIFIVIENHDENSMSYVMICVMSYEREVRLEAKKIKGKKRERSSKK